VIVIQAENSLSPLLRWVRTRRKARYEPSVKASTVFTVIVIQAENSLSPLLRWVRTRRKARYEPSVKASTVFTVIVIQTENSLSSSSLDPKAVALCPLPTQRENNYGPVVLPLRGSGAVIITA